MSLLQFLGRAICDVTLIVFISVFVIKNLKIYTNDAAPTDIILPYCEESPYGFGYDGFGATIFVRKNEVMLELPDEIKEPTLLAMGKKYGINFSKEELRKFRRMKTISVPMRDMKSCINELGSHFIKRGLKIDSANTELSDWITVSRGVNETVNNVISLRINVYADRELPYSQIKLIFNTLGSNKVKWANLIIMSKFKDPEFYVE